MLSAAMRDVLPGSGDIGPFTDDDRTRLQAMLPGDATCKLVPEKAGDGQAEMDVVCGRAVVLVADGRVEVLHDGRAEPPLQAPLVVGLVECLATRAPRTVIRALEPTTCYVIPILGGTIRRDSPDATPFLDRVCNEVPWVGRYVRQYYKAEMARLYRRNTSLEANLDDYFLPENAGLVPGPYAAADVEMRLFVMEDDPSRLARLLPPGLRLLPGADGRYLVACTRFADMKPTHQMVPARAFDYQETAFFIPTWGWPATMGFFCPALYPDSYLAIALGRELYGFPKRYGTTRVTDSAIGAGTIDFGLNEGLVFSASWSGAEWMEAGPFFQGVLSSVFQERAWVDWMGAGIADYLGAVKRGRYEAFWPEVPVFVRHEVPAPAFSDEKVPTLRVDRLVRIPFGVQEIRSFRCLRNPRVEFLDTDFPISGTCVSGWRLNLGMHFTDGIVVRDYGSARWWWEGRQRMARRVYDRARTFGRILVGIENPTIVGNGLQDQTELRIIREQNDMAQIQMED